MTRVKGSVFNTADQNLFINFVDSYPTALSDNAATNTTNLTTLLATLSVDGGVVVVPHGVALNTPSFPVTTAKIMYVILQGGKVKFKFNDAASTFEVESGTTSWLVAYLSATYSVTAGSFVQSLGHTTDVSDDYTLRATTDYAVHKKLDSVVYETLSVQGADIGKHYFGAGVAVKGALTGFTVAGSEYFIATAGNPVEVVTPIAAGTTSPATTTTKLVLDHSATIATHTINHPATPLDGQTFAVFSRSIITTLTLGSSASIATGHTVATLAALASIEWVWKASASKWYRIK